LAGLRQSPKRRNTHRPLIMTGSVQAAVSPRSSSGSLKTTQRIPASSARATASCRYRLD
jgi:hypothetical protein